MAYLKEDVVVLENDEWLNLQADKALLIRCLIRDIPLGTTWAMGSEDTII